MPISIHNNFLSQAEYDRCWDLLFNGSWKFSGSSGTVSSSTFWFMELMNNDFFTQYIFSKIVATVNKPLILLRCYANGHTFGIDGDFHQDSTDINDFTFLLYMNPITSKDVDTFGGYTMFKSSNNNIQCIEPIGNRGIFFNSNMFHKGLSFNRSSYDLRITVAFKCKLKEPKPHDT